MNYMIAILPKMAGFLLLVLIGFTASRIGVIKKEAMPSISGFLLKIVLPALTISLIWENQTTFYTMARYGRMVIAQILMYFIMAAGRILGSRICHLSGTTSNVHRGCSVGGNYGFLVIPLIMTLFGNQGGNVYIPICSVIDTTLGLDSWIYIIYEWSRTERKPVEKNHHESDFHFYHTWIMSDQFSHSSS